MSKIIICALSLAALAVAPVAIAQAPAAPPAAAAAAKLSSDSKVSALLADARAKAILQKHIPTIVEYAPNIPQITEVTLKELSTREQAVSQGGLTAEVLKKIETELAAL